MNIFVDLIAQAAITSATDSTPAIRPDLRAPTTYPITLYFLRQTTGGYAYVRFPSSVIKVGVRSTAPVETARFTLIFRGAETSEIDTRFSADQIRQLLEALPTVGAGNVSVAIPTPHDGSLTVEFTGALAGATLPTMSARIVTSTPNGAELNIEVLPDGKQQLTMRRPALAVTTTWTEVGIGTTPGWTGTLNTTSIPVSAWENPVGDIVLEVALTALPTRTANDGATAVDAVGRSGTNGQVIASPGVTDWARVNDDGNDSFLIGADSTDIYGRKFVPNDIGRVVTTSEGYTSPGTTIAEVMDDGVTNMARLSQRFTPEGLGLGFTSNYTLGSLPSDIYFSATANFTSADVGHVISGTSLPLDTRIIAIITSQYVRLSQRPSAIGTVLTWNILGEVSTVFTSGAALFQSGDVGAALRAPSVLNGDATITKFISPTQVVLDRQPTGSAVSVPWTLIPVRPYPPAVVSRLVSGDVNTQEVQNIALAQTARGGTLAIQDGYGGSMPLAVVNNPVGTSELEIALKRAYTNYGDVRVAEVVPGAEWIVMFGRGGAQRLLAVDESQATYDGVVLSWIMADAVQQPISSSTRIVPDIPGQSPTKVTRNGLVYIGADPAHLGNQNFVGQARITRSTDGTNALIMRKKVMMFVDQYVPPTMNSGSGGSYYFVGEEGGSEKNGLYMVDWVYATVPADRTERHNQMRTVMVPLYQKRGAVVLDIQLVSTSVSTWVDIIFHYWREGQSTPIPLDGPIGVVVHYSTVGGVEFQPTLWSQGGFDPVRGNYNLRFNQSWSRRRWMGHIWEQKVFNN